MSQHLSKHKSFRHVDLMTEQDGVVINRCTCGYIAGMDSCAVVTIWAPECCETFRKTKGIGMHWFTDKGEKDHCMNWSPRRSYGGAMRKQANEYCGETQDSKDKYEANHSTGSQDVIQENRKLTINMNKCAIKTQSDIKKLHKAEPCRSNAGNTKTNAATKLKTLHDKHEAVILPAVRISYTTINMNQSTTKTEMDFKKRHCKEVQQSNR